MNTGAPYEIGRYYQVPCVHVGTKSPFPGSKAPFSGSRIRWIPIMPPFHEDNEIVGFELGHYHYDPRFFPDRVYQWWVSFHGPYAKVLTKHPLYMGWGQREADFDESFFFEGIVYRRLKCRREFPTYPRERAFWLPKLEQAYAHTRLKNGVCPHKGVNLQSCPAVNGIVICPAHGLRWRADTGELVREIV